MKNQDKKENNEKSIRTKSSEEFKSPNTLELDNNKLVNSRLDSLYSWGVVLTASYIIRCVLQSFASEIPKIGEKVEKTAIIAFSFFLFHAFLIFSGQLMSF